MTVVSAPPAARVRRATLASRVGRMVGLGCPDRHIAARCGVDVGLLGSLRAEDAWVEGFASGAMFRQRVLAGWAVAGASESATQKTDHPAIDSGHDPSVNNRRVKDRGDTAAPSPGAPFGGHGYLGMA